MPPPDIFASHRFTSVDLVTLCVYAAFGGFFFLTALPSQVVAGFAPLEAGSPLLPTAAPLPFPGRSGALAAGTGRASR